LQVDLGLSAWSVDGESHFTLPMLS
jgi:hypothetical protein